MSVTIYASYIPEGSDVVNVVNGTPELNVANGNFCALMSALGYAGAARDMIGTLDVGKFSVKLSHFCERGERVTRENLSSHEPGCAEVIDGGLSPEQSDRYIATLWNIVFFCWENGVKTISFA